MQPEFRTTGPEHSGQTRIVAAVNGLDGRYRVGRSWGLGVVVMAASGSGGEQGEPEDTPKIRGVKKGRDKR